MGPLLQALSKRQHIIGTSVNLQARKYLNLEHSVSFIWVQPLIEISRRSVLFVSDAFICTGSKMR